MPNSMTKATARRGPTPGLNNIIALLENEGSLDDGEG